MRVQYAIKLRFYGDKKAKLELSIGKKGK